MSAPCSLLQYSVDPWNARFEDIESRLAFTVTMVEEDPNLIMRLTREKPWAEQNADKIMGPSNSYFYFGPSRTPGYLVYGNSPQQSMVDAWRQKKENSTSRYFTAQNGKEYKWRGRDAPRRFECCDSKGLTVALWEISQLEDEFHARLTVQHSALAIITELVTTLTLNRIALILNW
ncbi:uncharacterized protein FIBRA_07762 [Fibroporia radiculosa]|uniref:DUF6593 domain-containing protein n=1 Tax=Fibroporia radiculosa TaxID=599839 RepID=J4IBZ8_9APHY|nr:uncharacterized protein FIBRA_07762 [Fibroporia radiculosa]CCM05536.1 predicted protein [Fibroporia radiculosa]